MDGASPPRGELYIPEPRVAEAFSDGDVRVVQRSEHLRFPLEARQSIAIRGKDLQQDLQRHLALQPTTGAIDGMCGFRPDDRND
jgi:hypothetical protein